MIESVWELLERVVPEDLPAALADLFLYGNVFVDTFGRRIAPERVTPTDDEGG